ncbi:MAG: biotin--[acetyl-CoA-carboxylase] ligase [Bacillota bacterium]
MSQTSKRKQQVLELLYQHQAEYISGEELSQQLDVSRTTIWKYIQALRQQGYVIDSSSKLGYSLIKAPDILSPEEIKKDLQTKILGSEIIYHDQIDNSTNALAKDRARAGGQEGTIVIAREQLQGKGRLGRAYCCPPGGIWFSVILRPNLNPTAASQLSFVAAVAIAQTIDEITTLEPGIKWPNDILVNSKKIAGILTEMSAEIDQINHLILGLGINLNLDLEQFSSELAAKATSIQIELGHPVVKLDFFLKLLTYLEREYIKLQEEGFAAVLKTWRNYNITLNRQITVQHNDQQLEGQAVDIDDQGHLLLKTQQGEIKKLVAGDVTLQSTY